MIFTTSIPVWNLLFHDKWNLIKDKIAPPENVIAHYNAIQIWLGILAGMLTGLVQFFSYRVGKFPKSVKWGMYAFALSVVLAVVIALEARIPFTEQHLIDLTSVSKSLFIKFPFVSTYFLFLIASLYAILGNLAYMIFVVKDNLRIIGGSVAHFGFGVFLLGVLISQGEKQVISLNKSGINFGKDFKDSEKMENILLMKDSMLVMNEYEVTYTGTREEKPNHYYEVKYVRRDSATGKIAEEFTLLPNAQLNPKMGLIANPDTKHYLTRDVFTHVSSVPDNTNLKDTTLTLDAAVGDSFFTKTALLKVEALNPNPELPADYDRNGKLVVGISIVAKDEESHAYNAQPIFVIDMADGNSVSSIPAEVNQLGLNIDVTKIDPKSKKVTLLVHETEKPVDFIIMKAIVFPYINLVWLGGILVFLGALISMLRRALENKN